jgi:hypothetical protein
VNVDFSTGAAILIEGVTLLVCGALAATRLAFPLRA